MARRVLKYPLRVIGLNEIKTHGTAKILSVQVQDGVICLWVDSNDNDKPRTRLFEVYGTGHSIDHSSRDTVFIGTVQQGPFVWHVFEVPV